MRAWRDEWRERVSKPITQEPAGGFPIEYSNQIRTEFAANMWGSWCCRECIAAGTITCLGSLMYLGTYGKGVTAVFGLELAVTRASWSEMVAGYTFNYSNGYAVWIYDNGEFHGLNAAFNLGLITTEDVGAIHTAFYAQYPLGRW
jgi:hypothetical protein